MFPGARLNPLIARLQHARLADLLLLRHGSLFAIGVLLWLSLLHHWSAARLLGLIACVPGALLSIYSDQSSIVHESRLAFSPVYPAVAWAACIIAIIFSIRWNSAVHRLIGTSGARAARILGLMTYPLYLIHQQAGQAAIFRLHGHLPDLLSLTLVAALCVATSYLIVGYFEVPLQNRIRPLMHLSHKKSEVPAATLP